MPLDTGSTAGATGGTHGSRGGQGRRGASCPFRWGMSSCWEEEPGGAAPPTLPGLGGALGESRASLFRLPLGHLPAPEADTGVTRRTPSPLCEVRGFVPDPSPGGTSALLLRVSALARSPALLASSLVLGRALPAAFGARSTDGGAAAPPASTLHFPHPAPLQGVPSQSFSGETPVLQRDADRHGTGAPVGGDVVGQGAGAGGPGAGGSSGQSQTQPVKGRKRSGASGRAAGGGLRGGRSDGADAEGANEAE